LELPEGEGLDSRTRAIVLSRLAFAFRRSPRGTGYISQAARPSRGRFHEELHVSILSVHRPQVQAFRDSVEAEGWKSEHDDAMACRDLEQLLAVAVGT
jgi:hypothetical protein